MDRAVVRVLLPGLLLVLLALGGQAAQLGTFSGHRGIFANVPATSLAVDAADGNLLRAGGGLFRSTDQGQSWLPLSLPDHLDAGEIRAIATTSTVPDSLYAAGPGAGIVRSDDRGETWRVVSEGLPSQEIGAFAVHSYLPDTLYTWIEGQGVFRTEDGGGRWELMDEGPPSPVAALVHSTYEGSMNTGWLYAATPDGLYLSMDCF